MGSPNISDYLFLNVIGVGSNSTVFKAIRKDNPEELVAIKCFNFSRISKQTVNKIIESADFLKSLKHENIVQLKEFFISRSRMYFVLEYCDGGTFSNIISNILEINEVLCRTYMQQLDYGFAQHLTRKEYKSNIHGSPIYKSPEILLDEYFDNRADLWSIGVIIYECLFKKLPYYGLINEMTDKIKQRHQIEIPQIPRISNECKNLLTSLLQPVLNYRLTFEEFFSDKFVDLEHIPCEENFIKAKNIVMAGRDFEFENKLKEANDMYSEALKYFVPMLSSKNLNYFCYAY
ncbi:hypothetical protein M0802_000594 [Mischocyttarus mexicanus]|nr:hypothetical protein M0802_000594 [Mischocyttarus mexicanus]